MIEINPPQVSPLKNISLKIFLSHDLTSNLQNHRLLLREQLLQKLPQELSKEEKATLLDLNQLPKTNEYSISLSHCPLASVIAFTKKSHLLGVDVEQKERISEKLIARVAEQEEINGCPQPQALLSMKEAAWKCLNSYFPIATISQVETSLWKPIADNWSTFQVSQNGQSLPGTGFFTELSGLYLSIYILDSTFV